MFRVHFTAEDLAQVRLAPSAGAMSETMHSLWALRRRAGRPALDPWRKRVRAEARPWLASLAPLARHHHGVCLDLLSVCGIHESIDESAAALLAAEPGVLRAELDYLERGGGRLPAAFADLADADAARARLVEDLRRYHALAVAPLWGSVRERLDADSAARSLTMARYGVGGLLATLHPDLGWRDRVLSIHCADDGELHLAGRGLVVTPSYFVPRPTLHFDLLATGPAVLVHPALPALVDRQRSRSGPADSNRALHRLLGRTRATVLASIAGGTTTTGDLAVLTGTTTAAVSQHLAVLRDAKLVVTTRRGARVDHLVTSLGHELLGRP